jgi:competence protein ComFC
MFSRAKELVNAALAFFYPEVCQLCGAGRATPAQGFVCEVCQAESQTIEPPFCERCGRPYEGEITNPFECANCRDLELSFHFARSAVLAKGKVLEVIHRYKYKRALWFEPFLAGLLIERGLPALRGQGWDVVVPIPLHPTKQREREFNQAERLGRRLALALDLPCRRLLKRTRPTDSQTLLSREERQVNVRDAFEFANLSRLTGERVVLVDDVFTTGATSNACSRALLSAGAAEVCVWTVARGI